MKKLILLMMITVVVSQAIAVELSFKNPRLTSGSNNRVGAVYTFSDITTGVDALVKIVKFNNGASIAELDTTGGGLYDAFQPILKSGNNSDSSVEFEISFVEHSTTTPKLLSLDATGADIDGNNGQIREYIILSNPKSYSLENPTRLNASQDTGGLYVIPKNTANVSGITVTETRNIVTATYKNVSKIRYTIGAKKAYGQQRWNSLYFKDVSFSNPDIVTLPGDTIPPSPSIGNCREAFPSILNSIGDTITTTGSVKVNGTDILTTKILNLSGGTKCDGGICKKTNTFADKLDFDVIKGDGHNGTLASAWNNKIKTIAQDSEFTNINMGWKTTLNIKGDITVKVQGKCEIGGSSTVNINGNVTLYADNFHMNYGSNMNINGSLTIIANEGYFYSSTNISSSQTNFVVLTKDKLELNSGMKAKGVFYSGGTMQIYSSTRISGVVTANKMIINNDVEFNYDKTLVDAYCGGSSDEKPIVSISDSEVVEGDSGDTNLTFTVTLDKDAGIGVSFKYQVFDATNTDNSLNANSDDYKKLNFKSIVLIEESTRTIDINIPVKGDTRVENDEQFRITLSEVKGAIFGNSSAIGTIIDDDGSIGCTQDAWIVKDSESLFKMDIVSKNEQEFENAIKMTNGMGYNEADGYLWGYNLKDKDGTLVQIGKKFDGSYSSKVSSVIDGLPTGISIFIGDVDSHGNLYMMERKNSGSGLTLEKDMVYVVDLNNSSENYMKLTETFEVRDYNRGNPNIGKGLYIIDWAFHPKNGKLYSVSKDGRFYEIDPTTHEVKESKSIVGLDDSTSYETFFDENGYLYLYGKKVGKVFRLDLTDPNTPATDALLFASDLGTSNGGDAARCAKAPMGNKPIITLKESILEAEGNSGTTSIAFQMQADRDFKSSFDVTYEVKSGTAKIDDDFVKTSGSVKCIITTDTHVANCVLPIVKGDIIKEDDENFKIFFTSDSVIFINGENSTTGTIINDDSNSFTAYDIGNTDRKIQTKIVGKDFNLTLARLDSAGNPTSFGDENSTKVRIIDSSLCGSFDGDLNGFVDIDIKGVSSIKSPIFNSLIAIKHAKVQFFWIDEKDQNQTVCSADSFAIRPDKYSLSLPSSDIKSGEDFNLTIEAKDANNNPVSNYNELFSVYALDKSEIKASSGCTLGTLETVAQTNFINGVSIMTLNYKDIGKLKFVVSEINSSTTEYAHVDFDDGSSNNRFITEATITHKIEPANIDVKFSFKTKNNKNYTYFSTNPEHMGAIIDANITMLNKDNNTVSNFSSSCWADDVSLAIDFNQLDGLTAIPIFKDANGTAMASILTSSKLNYTMSKERFTSGKANREILMNFGRSVKDAKAPIKIKLSSPKASLGSLEKSDTENKTIDFVYARAHAPKIQSVVDENMTAIVKYEVYIPKDTDKIDYGFDSLPVSEDFGDWYVLNDDSTFGFDSPYARFIGVNVESYDSHGISLKVVKTPHSNRILFSPKEYLLYNQFNENAKLDSFQVTFYSKANTWLGKGKQGIILDDKASKRGLKKMDW